MMDILIENHIECPDNFILAGFDNLSSKPGSIPFVTIQQQHYKLGEVAARLVLERIEQHIVNTEQHITPRQACGKVRTGIL